MSLVTSALFFSLALLFFFLAAGVGTSEAAHNVTKFAGAWGFLVAAIAFYDGTAALMKDVYGKDILPVGRFNWQHTRTVGVHHPDCLTDAKLPPV